MTGFNTNGEFFQAIYLRDAAPDAQMFFGQSRCDRLLRQLAAGSDEARRIVDSAGGFLVPESFASDLLQRAWDFSPIASRCLNLPPVEGGSVKAPIWRETSRADGSRLGGVLSRWRGETFPAASSVRRLRELC